MKKITVALIALLLVLAGCGSNIMKDYAGFSKKNHHFETKKQSELVQDMVNKVPGFYYVGFADCPWCVALVPHLEEVLTDNDVTAMYLDVRDPQFVNNEALKEQYVEFLKTFPDGVTNGGASPFVFIITEDGTIKGHTGTAPTHDANVKDMTEKEIEFLNIRLNSLISDLKK